MTQFLPPNLLALFAPRDPIPYLPPVDKLPYEKRNAGYTGIAAYVNEFEDPMNTPPPVRIVTREERQENRRKEKAEQLAYKLEQDIALWNPNENPASTSDPYKTLFVARVNYDTAESKLRREFEMYGKIRKISIIYEKSTGKPRGYAFIEYDRERDMHAAYKHADGKKIDSRRVLVDVERGRTVNGWLPRRLGGGLGGTRRGGPDVNLKHSGREEPRPEDRHLNRERGERDRAERPERRRSRSRDRRRRSRSRSRERHRGDRHKRDRSRDRTREHDVGAPAEKIEVVPELPVEVVPDAEPRKESRRRSRSRDRDRRRRRSRSRDRKRRDDRDRDGRRDRERERPRDQGPRDQGPRDQDDRVIKEESMIPEIKQENFDNGYEDNYNNYNSNNNNDMESAPYEGY